MITITVFVDENTVSRHRIGKTRCVDIGKSTQCVCIRSPPCVQDMEVSLDAVGMLVRRVAYSWPPLFNYLPAPVVDAAIATVKTGQAARRWVVQATTTVEI